MLSREIVRILTPLSPLSWVSESFRQDIGQFHAPRMKHLSNPFSRFQLGKFFMKNVTDFHKTVETGSLFIEKSANFDWFDVDSK